MHDYTDTHIGQATDQSYATNSQLHKCNNTVKAKARSASKRTGSPSRMQTVEAEVNGFT